MIHFFSPYARQFCVCSFATFSLCLAPQLQGFSDLKAQINFNDLALVLRLEKFVDEIKKQKELQDQESLFTTLGELKIEVESYLGRSVNLDVELNNLGSAVKASGGELKKDEFKMVSKIIKDKINRTKHKALFIAECAQNGIEYTPELEELSFRTAKKNPRIEKINEKDIPPKLIFGVSISLSGLLLTYIPNSICISNGPKFVQEGVALAVEGTLNRN